MPRSIEAAGATAVGANAVMTGDISAVGALVVGAGAVVTGNIEVCERERRGGGEREQASERARVNPLI